MIKKLTFSLLLIFLHIKNLNANTIDMQNFLFKYYHSSERNQKNYSKLCYAIENNYISIAIKLIEHGEDPNYSPKSPYNYCTPLLMAIRKEDEELVFSMIKKGTIINLDALLLATNNSSNNITQMLCDTGIIIQDTENKALYLTLIKADALKFL